MANSLPKQGWLEMHSWQFLFSFVFWSEWCPPKIHVLKAKCGCIWALKGAIKVKQGHKSEVLIL